MQLLFYVLLRFPCFIVYSLDKISCNLLKQKVLSEAGYVPSNTEKYPLGGVISAIQNAFHVTPSLSCSNGAVEELQICFYKDFKV